jgi:Flp pilus assembly pilin Flp
MIRLGFLRRRRGAGAVEYGLAVGLIAVAVISGVSAAGGSINSLLTLTGERIGGIFDDPAGDDGGPPADAAPLGVSFSDAVASLPENAAPGADGHLVATVSVSDDGRSAVTLSLSDGVNFKLVGNTLYLTASLDYESGQTSFGTTVTAVDAVGSAVSPPLVVSVSDVDETPPSAPVIASVSPDSGVIGDGITKDTTLVLSGTAEAGSTVAVTDGATALGTATADGSGAWSFTTAALTDGSHGFTATATDAAGNIGPASAVFVVTVDTAVSPFTFNAISGPIANSWTASLSGTVETGSSVAISGAASGSASVSGTTWSFTTPALTTAGSNSFTATATDAAGNVSSGVTQGVTVNKDCAGSLTDSDRGILCADGSRFAGLYPVGSPFAGQKLFIAASDASTSITWNDGTGSWLDTELDDVTCFPCVGNVLELDDQFFEYDTDANGEDGWNAAWDGASNSSFLWDKDVAGTPGTQYSPAVRACASPWFLPSTNELNMIYACSTTGNCGSFGSEYYWSSSENGYHLSAWSQRISDGHRENFLKDHLYSVRCARR